MLRVDVSVPIGDACKSKASAHWPVVAKFDAHASMAHLLESDAAPLPGAVVGVCGGSGAGKTTLLMALAGLLRPTEGCVSVAGQTWFDAKNRVCLPPHRRAVGVCFQDDRLWSGKTVAQHLKFARKHGQHATDVAWDDVVDGLGLRPLLDRRVDALSGGEKRRVGMGRALVGGPALLLLDEPLNGLDETACGQLLSAMGRLLATPGLVTVVVSHRMDHLMHWTDRLLRLERGQVVADGPVAGWLNQPDTAEWLDVQQPINRLPVAFELGAKILEADGLCVHGTGNQHGKLLTEESDWAPPQASKATGLALFAPSEVALAPETVPGLSVQNQWPARLTGAVVRQHDVVCRLVLCGKQPTSQAHHAEVLAAVSHAAWKEMKHKLGQTVCVLVKASAVQWV